MKTVFKISDFKDYRDFLKELFEQNKKLKPKTVSLESYSRKLKISKTYFRYVIEKKRHLTLDQVAGFAKVFGLTRKEKEIFTYMVCSAASKDAEIQTFFSAIISNLADEGVKGSLKESLSTTKDKIFDNWLAMVIHSLARQSAFQPNADWIMKVLTNNQVERSQVDYVLNSLLKTKSIIVDTETGRWRPSAFVFNKPTPEVLTGYEVYKVGVNAVLPAMERPEQFAPSEFHMMSLSFDEDSIKKMKETLQACRNALIKLAQETPDPTGVMFANLNFAAMAKR